MDYIRAVDDYLHGPSSATSSARRSRRPASAPLDYFLNDCHEGYCQHYAGAMALLLRMGGIPARVATGFSPGGYSARQKAWIVRDTDAHAWVEVVVRQVRLGHARPDAGRDARRARRSPRSRRVRGRHAGPGGRHRRRRRRGQHRATPNLSRAPGAAARRRGDGAERGARPDGGVPFWGWALGVLGVVALLLARAAVPAPPARQDADGPRDRRGRGRAAARRAAGHHRHDADPARAPARLALPRGRAPTCARSPPAATRRRREPPPRTGRRALRRALAQGLGFGGRSRALWALPPRVERRPRRVAHAASVETRVRA